MPKHMETKDQQITAKQAEIDSLEIALGDMTKAYCELHRACEAVIACRDLVIGEGVQRNMLKVYSLVENAMSQAEQFYGLASEARFDQSWRFCETCFQFVNPSSASPCCKHPALVNLK